MSKFTAAEQDAINRDARATLAARALGLVGILDDLYALILAGSVGITSLAADVDSVALGGGVCTQNPNTTAGLTFGWNAGRFHNGLINVVIPAGTLALAASQTNYVEFDRTGTMFANTSGFTSGRGAMWTITTGVSSISAIVFNKPIITLIGTGGVVGSMLSTAGATKTLQFPLGDLSATTSPPPFIMPNIAGVITKVRLLNTATVASDNTNYWTFGVVNKGAAGAGTTPIVDNTVAANSTKTTGGSGTTAYVVRDLTLNATPANLVTAAGDVLEFTATKAAAASNLTHCTLEIDVLFTG